MKPAFSKYASAIVEHDVTGIFLASASDEELSEMFKEMHVSLAHKVELREAVAAWRADPQRVLFPLCFATAPAFLPLHPRAHLLPSLLPSPEQALQAVERESAAEVERQRKIREEEERQRKIREEEERQRKIREEEERQRKIRGEEERQRKIREEEEHKLKAAAVKVLFTSAAL